MAAGRRYSPGSDVAPRSDVQQAPVPLDGPVTLPRSGSRGQTVTSPSKIDGRTLEQYPALSLDAAPGRCPPSADARPLARPYAWPDVALLGQPLAVEIGLNAVAVRDRQSRRAVSVMHVRARRPLLAPFSCTAGRHDVAQSLRRRERPSPAHTRSGSVRNRIVLAQRSAKRDERSLPDLRRCKSRADVAIHYCDSRIQTINGLFQLRKRQLVAPRVTPTPSPFVSGALADWN
jgi:hypothetical protein